MATEPCTTASMCIACGDSARLDVMECGGGVGWVALLAFGIEVYTCIGMPVAIFVYSIQPR